MAAQPILLADDDANQAFLAVRAFKDAGVARPVAVVDTGNAAIDYLVAAQPLPCLVLLDQTLPGRSGLEVLEWLRGRAATCTIPVLMLTSSTSSSDARAAYLLGANGYLVKPASFDEMLRLARAIKDYWLDFNRSA